MWRWLILDEAREGLVALHARSVDRCEVSLVREVSDKRNRFCSDAQIVVVGEDYIDWERLLADVCAQLLPSTPLRVHFGRQVRVEEAEGMQMWLLFAGFVDIKQDGSNWTAATPAFDKTTKTVIDADSNMSVKQACGPANKRKPCANCNCGAKESGVVKSACGSCHLGDEYRCSTCPYLGQPAFDPSDPTRVKLVL